MARYYCHYCEKYLIHDKPKARKIHNNGAKHNLLRTTYYLELLETHKYQFDNILRLIDLNKPNKSIQAISIKDNSKPKSFVMPDMIFPSNFAIPPEPKGFKLPPDFDFHDPSNFPKDYSEIIKRFI
ncbi:U1 small nuclear ribonucleoprotein C [Astathelohania contejeani]|uniref:U1 small nuclear ribonucleoprotein C n=1 Tax=Astathelohania contejeani TaxID=164912 RepID=A0ABQ7HZD7_9MICR|nr:U1 small nuclear ribonucleoprotein C [Thelohania contejeani]